MSNINKNHQAENAIKWIESLPTYKQATGIDRTVLGSKSKGYCCIGAGCKILDIEFEEDDGISKLFRSAVGLYGESGDFIAKEDKVRPRYYGKPSLAEINDYTDAGFKRIANLMKRHPDWMFENGVAEIIAKYYSDKLNSRRNK